MGSFHKPTFSLDFINLVLAKAGQGDLTCFEGIERVLKIKVAQILDDVRKITSKFLYDVVFFGIDYHIMCSRRLITYCFHS
jgi:hypothetical protein